MIKTVLIDGFNRSTYGNNLKSGERVFKNDLISDYNYEDNNDKIIITSNVISEDLYNKYSCKIDIDRISKEVVCCSCSCDDFQKGISKKDNYCCKHIVASFYKFINLIDTDSSIKDIIDINKESTIIDKKSEQSILDLLLLNDYNKREIKFEIILNRSSWTNKLSAEFKIGYKDMKSNKLYTLKDIDSFLVAIYNNIPLYYGKDFTLNSKEQRLGINEKKIVKFIELLKDIDLNSGSFRKVSERLVSNKQINIPKGLLREFLLIIKDNRVYLGTGFYSRTIETEILDKKIPIPIDLSKIGEIIKLEAPNGIPESLGDSDEVFLYNSVIYTPPYDQIELMIPYIKALNYSKSIFFSESEENRVLRELVPSIQNLSDGLTLSRNLRDKVIISPVNFKFYFDKLDNEVYLILKVCYENYQFNCFSNCEEKVIFRDHKKETQIINILKEFGFERIDDRFIFLKDDDHIFSFFKNGILELHKYGEIFYSDKFKIIKNIKPSEIKGNIKKGSYEYFEFSFSISDISEEETYNILAAFRDNKHYYKLSNGQYLDLEQIEIRNFIKLLDSLEKENNLNNNTIKFNKNRGIYVESYLEDNNIKYMRGRNQLKDLKKSIELLKNNEFEIPDINAKLRDYQKEGFIWMKTLNYLGFGGILGDEMGLGKTIQAISFIASELGSKTLIVTPTSLIYNWLNEFNKFAPYIKVCIVNGSIEERKESLIKFNNYDVIITTYNLLRRDIENYIDLQFDYCIIDEAQNIKNSNSLNSRSVKSIKAKNRFALTGTPIENSLIELWSIFDFIMPGYLYDEKRFSTMYDRNLHEEAYIIEDLTRLIKPFILKRYKKDVVKELPDKIEKKVIVPLTSDQAEIYKTYVEYIKSIIEKKVKYDEFRKSKIEILSYITKLRQICLDPSLVMNNYNGSSAKIEYLLKIVKYYIRDNHKIIIFSQFTSALKNICEVFDKNTINYFYLDGGTEPKKRFELVNKFNNSESSVFLISLKAGGTGLNITSADIVIHFDPWWNPAVEEQATDRAHRIGQKNVVEVIKLIAAGTIEEKIIQLQDKKNELINKVLNNDIVKDDVKYIFNEDDILSLFSD